MEKIGRYEVEHLLSQGSWANIYLARDPKAERQVAIKIIEKDVSHLEEIRVRFKIAAQLMAALEQRAIVPIHDSDEFEGQPFIVMRYMPGGTLMERVQPGALPTLIAVATLMERIAGALDEAHARDIVHGGVTPKHILFDAQGHGSLSGFDFARKINALPNPLDKAYYVGNPVYLSPEQLLDEPLDGRSDVYTLGLVLYKMLSGQEPFQVDTPMGVVTAKIAGSIRNMRAVRADLPPDIDDLFRKALATKREERYARASALANDFRRIVDSIAGQPNAPLR
jgi:serine/threonine protein kinase